MNTKLTAIAVLLIFIIAVGALMVIPAPQTAQAPGVQAPVATSTTPASDMSDQIVVTSPAPNSKIASTSLTVTGKARGSWYFEGSFPAKLLDANGTQLALAPVRAEGDWMTSDFVPFTVTLTFTRPTTPTGTLILKNDNPSGLSANDKQIEIHVRF